MITFNKGGFWGRIPAPMTDSNNENIDCGEYCYLNIRTSSKEKFNSFYSSINAVGLVLANGNVGNYLSHSPESINTYLSRDAGLTWKEVRKGPNVF